MLLCCLWRALALPILIFEFFLGLFPIFFFTSPERIDAAAEASLFVRQPFFIFLL
jgi:hypothetical protein